MEDAGKIETGVEGKPLETQVTELKKALDGYTSAKASSAPETDGLRAIDALAEV